MVFVPLVRCVQTFPQKAPFRAGAPNGIRPAHDRPARTPRRERRFRYAAGGARRAGGGPLAKGHSLPSSDKMESSLILPAPSKVSLIRQRPQSAQRPPPSTSFPSAPFSVTIAPPTSTDGPKSTVATALYTVSASFLLFPFTPVGNLLNRAPTGETPNVPLTGQVSIAPEVAHHTDTKIFGGLVVQSTTL